MKVSIIRRLAYSLLVAGSLWIAGCGSGGSTSPSATARTSPVDASRSFISKGGGNKIPNFGQEVGEPEREAASQVLEENLEARAAGDWGGQCATLSVAAVKRIKETVPPAEGKTCAKALATEAEPAEQTEAVRADTMTGPIAALRIKGDKGYALYHGVKDADYAMEMEKEGDRWKVSALVTVTP